MKAAVAFPNLHPARVGALEGLYSFFRCKTITVSELFVTWILLWLLLFAIMNVHKTAHGDWQKDDFPGGA